MVDTQKLLEIASYLSIIHHIKGRIRVRVNPKIKEQGKNISIKDIEDIANKINGIKKIKINKVVGSITVEYDHIIFPDQLWKDMIEGENLEDIVKRINELSQEAM